jgi:hypothetical protein
VGALLQVVMIRLTVRPGAVALMVRVGFCDLSTEKLNESFKFSCFVQCLPIATICHF